MRHTIWILVLLLGCTGTSEQTSISYTVQRGDSLAKIARAHQVSVGELRSWNQIEGNLIHPGQTLMIQTTSAGRASAKHSVRPTRRRTAGREKEHRRTRPKPKPCLSGPSLDDLEADAGMAASAGLSLKQLRTSMNRHIQETLVCGELGVSPSGRLLVEITVGCNGLVTGIKVMDEGPFEPLFVECVSKILYDGEFPAHDMPDGYSFDYPLNFSF